MLSLLWIAAVLPPGYEDVACCPKGSCLRPVYNPDGFAGPRSAMVECWDPNAAYSPVDEIWTGSQVVADLPQDWEAAPACPDPPSPPAPPSPPSPPFTPPAPPIPPPLYVCLLHAGTFSRKLQIFATVRLETDAENHCLVGGASGGLGSGQAIAEAYFPTVPENALSERDRHAHSCCVFDGRYLALSGAERVRVDIFDYDTFNANDYLGGSFFRLDKFAYLKHPQRAPTEDEGGDPEDDAGDEAEAGDGTDTYGGEGEGVLSHGEEEYRMTYSYDGPWHSPQPQMLSVNVTSADTSETADFSITIKLARDLPSDCGVADRWGNPQALLESGHLIGAAPLFASNVKAEPTPRGRMVRVTDTAGVLLLGAVAAGAAVAAVGAAAVARRRRAPPMEPLL